MRSLPIPLDTEISKAAQYGAYLLQIDFDSPLRYTTLDVSLRYDSKTWESKRFNFSFVQSVLAEEIDRMELTIDNADFSLTSAFLDQIVRRKLLWLWYIGLTYPATPIGVSLVFNGQIDQLEVDKTTIKIDVLSALAYWRKRVPGRIYQATCPWVFEPLLSTTDPRKGKYCRYIAHELCPDGDFGVVGDWIAGADWTINWGVAIKAPTGATLLIYNDTVVADKDYLVRYTINTISGGSLTPYLGGVAGISRTNPGMYSETIHTTTTNSIRFTGDATTACEIDDVSIKTNWCNQSYNRCKDLGNEENYGGFRYLPYMINRTFKWGPENM